MAKVISFYTLDTLYEKEANNLRESCEKFGLDHHIEGVKNLGSWEENCSYKATFIKEKLLQFKQPLLWVDADGAFVDHPTLIETLNCDLAVWIDPNLELSHPSKVISAAIYLNYTEKTLTLLDDWIEECKKHKGKVWDQITLRDILFREDQLAKITPLPQEYCMIFDKVEEHHKPVIMQYQASRLYKKLINNEIAPFFGEI